MPPARGVFSNPRRAVSAAPCWSRCLRPRQAEISSFFAVLPRLFLLLHTRAAQSTTQPAPPGASTPTLSASCAYPCPSPVSNPNYTRYGAFRTPPLALGITPRLARPVSRVKSRKAFHPSTQLMTPSSDNLVEITDVKFNYGEREILKGLSLNI